MVNISVNKTQLLGKRMKKLKKKIITYQILRSSMFRVSLGFASQPEIKQRIEFALITTSANKNFMFVKVIKKIFWRSIVKILKNFGLFWKKVNCNEILITFWEILRKLYENYLKNFCEIIRKFNFANIFDIFWRHFSFIKTP